MKTGLCKGLNVSRGLSEIDTLSREETFSKMFCLPSGFPTDSFKKVLLFQFCSVCVSVVSYVAFVFFLFGPYLSFLWYLGRAVLRDCGISLVSSLIFFPSEKGVNS